MHHNSKWDRWHQFYDTITQLWHSTELLCYFTNTIHTAYLSRNDMRRPTAMIVVNCRSFCSLGSELESTGYAATRSPLTSRRGRNVGHARSRSSPVDADDGRWMELRFRHAILFRYLLGARNYKNKRAAPTTHRYLLPVYVQWNVSKFV